ncbi:MAG: hypothetical protein JSS65_02520 [Armatimonadetes bacterium]|nr:hypothetical protein [Armatimonadota bacterium]
MSAELTALFDYDLWANRLWAAYLAERDWPETESQIFRHILAASTIWLQRIEGDSPASMPEPSLDDLTQRDLHDRWVRVLQGRDLDEVIAYRRTSGEALQSRLGDIARHVVNHGTYHRGELRGLCKAAGRSDFPETDLIRFVLESS